MDWEKATGIYREIREAVTGDDLLRQLLDDLDIRAVRYAQMRSDWRVKDKIWRTAMDAERTRAHDAFIDACNILSRNMGQRGLNNGWRARLGEDRKVIGDWACFIHCFLGLEVR